MRNDNHTKCRTFVLKGPRPILLGAMDFTPKFQASNYGDLLTSAAGPAASSARPSAAAPSLAGHNADCHHCQQL